MKITEEMRQAFYSKAEVQRTGAIRYLDEAITAALTAAPAEDWTVSASETAREVLDYLGTGSDPSLEPGADRRRDNVAKIITKHFDRVRGEALAAAEQPVAVQVGELAAAWKNHVAAVEAHSSEVKKLRSARWAGDFSMGFSEGVIAADRVMADAQSAFIKAAQDVAKAALASPAQPTPPQDTGDNETLSIVTQKGTHGNDRETL